MTAKKIINNTNNMITYTLTATYNNKVLVQDTVFSIDNINTHSFVEVAQNYYKEALIDENRDVLMEYYVLNDGRAVLDDDLSDAFDDWSGELTIDKIKEITNANE